ncbi:cell wall [Trichoderma arundinaceum]|uniref:Cell wall n=1 Tax=Trichoderma arundinaceum TaxID=490622 RepID=A0A395NJ24_TRIAR|nr:cell wall [Trichoderma arundinaceum]
MKFTSVALAFAAFGAYSSALLDRDLQDRDLRTIQGVLNKVSSAITSLDNAARSFSGNTKPVVDKAKELINTINIGKTTVDGSGGLGPIEASNLISPVQALNKKAETLANNFVAHRRDIEKANGCSIVRDNLDQISRSSRNLINSIISKVPRVVQSSARELASGLIEIFDQVKDNFSPNKCRDSGPRLSKPRSAAATTEISLVGGSTSIPTWTSKASTQARVPTTTTTPAIPAPAVTAGAAVMAPASMLAMVIAAVLLW